MQRKLAETWISILCDKMADIDLWERTKYICIKATYEIMTYGERE